MAWHCTMLHWICMVWHCVALHGITRFAWHLQGHYVALHRVAWQWSLPHCLVRSESTIFYCHAMPCNATQYHATLMVFAWHGMALHDISWHCRAITLHRMALHGSRAYHNVSYSVRQPCSTAMQSHPMPCEALQCHATIMVDTVRYE